MAFTLTSPDADNCRTRQVHDQVYRCLANDICWCPYAQAFAMGLYCQHPNRSGFKVRSGPYIPVIRTFGT
jgi:hypothetical protein